MATKKEWQEYLKKVKKYHKDYAKYIIALEKYIKGMKPGSTTTQDLETPPKPPPNP